MLKLIKTNGSTTTQERVFRMLLDMRLLSMLNDAEVRKIYDQLEAIRNQLSRMLERAGHV